MSNLAVIILAAGQGTRMKSSLPKVLHRVAGLPMVCHVASAAAQLQPERMVVVLAPGMEAVEREVRTVVDGIEVAIQHKAQGTGDAVRAATALLEGFTGTVLILCGDAPLVPLQNMEDLIARTKDHAVAILALEATQQNAYGRLVATGDRVLRIVEFKDASEEERAITLCNAGVIAARAPVLFPLLEQLENKNASNEYYLTDVAGLANAAGHSCGYAVGEERLLLGVNTRAQLAEAERMWQEQARAYWMAEGVTLVDPDSVFFSADTQLGRDVVIQPNVFFGPGVTVADNVLIRSFCHLEGAKMATGSIMGPFARLRPGADLAEGVHIGNFVEIKNAAIGAGAKVNHLSYVGDAVVGAEANIGAGTITCNYDGYSKYRTEIGAGAFIGSNTSLVAPVKVGAGAVIGAGSVITRDVDELSLAVTRAVQNNVAGWAEENRRRKKGE